MSPSVKLSLLTLVSSAAAVPHYGRHSKFHYKPSGGYGTGVPYPTGGWNNNGTYHHPSGTGASYSSQTTTLLETLYSTATLVETVYATHAHSSAVSAGAEEVSTGAAACGPATVYVTATNKVTVTVPGPGYVAPSSSSSAAVVYAPSSAAHPESHAAPSSASSAYSAPAYSAPPVSYALPSSSAAPVAYSSSVAENKVTISLPNKPVETPSKVVYSSQAPVSSAAAVTPSSSAAAVSSASATPTAPTYSGGKRGLAYNDGSLCSSFDTSKFSFAYNWGSTAYGKPCGNVPYVPMMHKPSDMSASAWLANVDTAVKNGAKVVMGFNEPDHPDQANLSPQDACNYWKEYMNPIAAKYPAVTILGPSVTNGGGSMGLAWLQQFQDICHDAVWHAANLHFYDIPDGEGCKNTIQRFQDHIAKGISQTGKVAWVTEFGLNAGSASDDQAAAFLQGTMKYLEGESKVNGYAYFMVAPVTNQHQLISGNGLSNTGEVYNA